MVPEADGALLRDALAQLRDVTSAAIELGGRPYLYGRYDLTDADRMRCYGRDYTRFLELKRALDPGDRFASGRTML
jgi:FAD/FMN-containing dehydrogenase